MLLANAAGLFGIWLYMIVAICSVRYTMVLLEARARGVAPEPPGIEMFSLVGSGWTLFPVVHLALGYGLVLLGGAVLGGGGAFALGAAYVMVLPALFAVLAITRSPLESLNLGTAFRLIGRIGYGYWAAPAALLLAALLPALIPDLPRPVALVLDHDGGEGRRRRGGAGSFGGPVGRPGAGGQRRHRALGRGVGVGGEVPGPVSTPVGGYTVRFTGGSREQ